MKSRFETKLGYFVKRYCTFACCYLSTHFLNLMTPDLLWKGSHIHIFTVIFVISIILMNADNLHIETCRFKVTFTYGFHYLSQDIGATSRLIFLLLPRERESLRQSLT